MTSTIDSLFDGDIRPAEDILAYSDELRELNAQSAKILMDIRNTRTESQRTKIDDYAELKNRICDEAAKTGFRMGLSLGVKLLTESFYYTPNSTEETESDN